MVSDYRNSVMVERVFPFKSGEPQFPDEGAILIATKLLHRLREQYYFDRPRVRYAIDDAYKWLVERMRLVGVSPLTTSSKPTGGRLG